MLVTEKQIEKQSYALKLCKKGGECTVKFLKLINNEHNFRHMNNIKGCVEDACSVTDRAVCTTNAIDVCKADYAACYGNAIDRCGGWTDTTVCYSNQKDITE